MLNKLFELFLGLVLALAFFGMFWVSFFFDRLPI
jgi:hypothetical protein